MQKNESSKPTLTYNVRAITSPEVKDYWLRLLSEAARAYDDLCIRVKQDNVKLSPASIQEAFYYPIREKYTMLTSQMTIKVIRDACGALRSILSNKKQGKAKDAEKHNLSMRLDARLYARLNVEGLDVTGGNKGKRDHFSFNAYPKLREMFDNYKPCDPLIFVRGGDLWLSIPFEVPVTEQVGDHAVGIDLGMRRLFVTSDGTAFVDKDYLRKRRQVRYLKRQLQSKGTKSAKRRLKKKAKKEARMCKDMCYRAVKQLLNTTDAPVLVMEDLQNIKQNTSRHKRKTKQEQPKETTEKKGKKRTRHNNAFHQVPIRMFRELLAYKAQLVGRRVETVDPANTSKTDSRTGRMDGIRKGCRYLCADGKVLDADWNAAANIALRSSRPVSNPTPVDGGLRFLSGRPSVNRAYRRNCCALHNDYLQAALSLAAR